MAVITRGETMVSRTSPQITERALNGIPGQPMFGLGVALGLGGATLILTNEALAALFGTGSAGAMGWIVGILLAIVACLVFAGLTAVAPGEARVVELFGRYLGTVRSTGLRWVNPLARRRIVSTRLRNHETPLAKVNDADGNPIEISAVVVWQVEDTARALYDVDNFVAFVNTQAETAVRHIATSYPYDRYGGGQISLRENAEEITGELAAEITARVAAAGVRVVESRITRLAYAPEIAPAMLRRQQADAMVAARQRVVEGAVGMVQLALRRLEEEDVISLDLERKAAMVSNLLVVLCSDHASQPVVNVGSLYH